MVSITINVKDMFFDVPKIVAAMDEAKHKNLSKQLAFIRLTAKQSLKRKKKSSAPGRTPNVHSNSKFANLKNILFFYDRNTDSGIVGPVGFGNIKPAVPHLMEKGGSWHGRSQLVQVSNAEAKRGTSVNGKKLRLEYDYKTHTRIAKQQNRKPKYFALVTGKRQYAPRPFMEPALDKELAEGRVSDIWANSIEVQG